MRIRRQRRGICIPLGCWALTIALSTSLSGCGAQDRPVETSGQSTTIQAPSTSTATPFGGEPPSSSSSPTASPDPVVPGEAAVRSAMRSMTLSQVAEVVDALRDRSGPTDPRYYADETWHDGDEACFRCDLGPAALSASYGVVVDDAAARRRAVGAFDRAIREHQADDGSFSAPGVRDGPGIQTIFFGVLLAQTYLTLGPTLDRDSARTWRRSLAAAAGYLDDAGWTQWYANGNLVLAETVFLDLTGKVLGEDSYHHRADAEYTFLIAPPQKEWLGFGLHYVTHPTRADGSDGAAFLAEKGGGTPGFDAEYTLLQLSLATDWYVFTGDPRARRLANLLINALLPRLDTTSWSVDIAAGTRRGSPGARDTFTGSGLPVLALGAGRTDLLADVVPQAVQRGRINRGTVTRSSPGVSYGFGVDLAALVWALRG